MLPTMVSMARVRTVWTGVAGSPFYSNSYFVAGEDAVLDPQGDADSVVNFLTNIVPELKGGLVATVQPEVAIVDSVSGDITGFVAVDVDPLTFTNAGNALPWMTQMLVQLSTGTVAGGRRVRGRFNLPGCVESSNQDGGTPDPALRNGVRDAYAAQMLGGPDTHVVWSRKNGVAAEVTGVAVWTQWATLRSRRD